MPVLRPWWIALTCALTVLAGCDLTGSHPTDSSRSNGRVGGRGGDGGSDEVTPQPDTIGVSASRISVSQGTVSFTVKVPSGGPGCTGRPQAVVKGYDAKVVTVDTVVDTNLSATCDRTVRRTFTSALDLQGRQLRVNGVLYEVTGATVTACDDELGCNPPANRCDPAWTTRVIPHYDLPPAKSTRVVSCHAHWLVLDVKATANSGAVQYVRWFAELDPQRRWQVVATSRTGGCVDVRLAVPSYPLRYCRNLGSPAAGG